jgi:hypothetical protein
MEEINKNEEMHKREYRQLIPHHVDREVFLGNYKQFLPTHFGEGKFSLETIDISCLPNCGEGRD